MARKDVSEYRRTLRTLEEDFRHDLALHLYSVVLLRRLDPRVPLKRWLFWPLPEHLVPDPRTQQLYVDDSIVDGDTVDFEEEQNQLELEEFVESANERRMLQPPSLLPRTRPQLPLQHSDDESDDSFVDAEEFIGSSDESSDSESVSEPDLEEEQVEADSEEEIDSGSDAEPELSTHVKAVRITLKHPPTEPQADLFLEMKALVTRLINKKVHALNLPPNQGPAVDLNHELIDLMALQLCYKTDNLLQEISMMCHPRRKLRAEKAVNWQDVLLADLPHDTSPIPSHDKINFYEKCERIFHQPNYKYEYNNVDVEETKTFQYAEYLDLFEDIKQRSTKKHTLRRKNTRDQDHLRKRLYFYKFLEHEQENEEVSVDKGHISVFGPAAKLQNYEPREHALRHQGARLDANEYIVDF